MFQLATAPTGLPSPDEITVPDTSVVALLVTAGHLHHRTHTSLVRTVLYDQEHGWNNYKGELVHTSGANISKARNEILRRFLDETTAEWAWLIDSDMEIPQETLPRLLCSAAVSGAKVIGGLCCMIGDDGPIPTMFQLGDFDAGEVTRVMLDYEPNTVTQVAATGMACLLVHRSVLEHFAAMDGNYPFVFEAEINGQWVSEDVLFCLRCNDAGFPVFVDCSTEIGHVKGTSVWWPSDIARGRGFPTQKTYAVVPSKTLHLARATARMLHGQVERTIILDNTRDGRIHQALDGLDGVTVIPMPDVGIHEMWNHGITEALEHADQRRNVNVLVLNDDLRFGPRFARRMVEALRSDPDLVAVSGNYDHRTSDQLVEPTSDICAGRYDGTGGFAGFAFAVRGEWMQSGYRFPEQCKWWFGDNDLLQAVAVNGKGWVGIAIDAEVEHLDGGSKTGGDWSDFAEQIRKDQEAFQARWAPLTPPKVTILSANYGGYDQVAPAVEQTIPVDWLLVTDQPTDVQGRRVMARTSDHPPRHAARHPKLHPHAYTDNGVAIWVDGRVVVQSPQFAAWCVHHLGDADVAVFRHPARSTIAEEAEAAAVEQAAKYDPDQLSRQAAKYLDSGHPDTDLWQLTIMVWRLNDRTRRLGDRWAEEIDAWPDSIDQISFPVVARELDVKVADLPGGFWDHPDLFTLTPHADGT